VPSAIEVRPATLGDLTAAARIKAAGDVDQTTRMHALAAVSPGTLESRISGALAALELLSHEDRRQVWIAAAAGEVIGEASAAFRDRHAHIQSFFITPDSQQRGIGGGLLQLLLGAAQEAGCSVFSLQASDDPRALGLYLREGFLPQAPNIVWTSANPSFPKTRLDDPFEQIPIEPRDEATLNTVGDIDKAVRGARRRQDLDRWLAEGASGTLFIERTTGRPVGYGFVTASETTGRIGPVAAIDNARFPEILRGVLVQAGRRHNADRTWRAAVPGENLAAIQQLHVAGFRPWFSLPFLATAPVGQFDRYCFHDLDFL
jgi:GNAT superfamily N-acetyltransferase